MFFESFLLGFYDIVSLYPAVRVEFLFTSEKRVCLELVKTSDILCVFTVGHSVMFSYPLGVSVEHTKLRSKKELDLILKKF